MMYSPASFQRKLGLVSLFVLVSLSCPNHGFAMDDDQNEGLFQPMYPKQDQDNSLLNKTKNLPNAESAKVTLPLDLVQNSMDIETNNPEKSILDVRLTSTKTPSDPTN